MSWCSHQSLLESSSTLAPRSLLPSTRLLSLLMGSCTPVIKMVTLKSRRHWSRPADPAVVKEGAQQALSQLRGYPASGKEATLQQHSQTVGNGVRSCPPYTEQRGSLQDDEDLG